jgi:hypothetical protein
MEWFAHFGNFGQLMPGAPALALQFALHSNADLEGYAMAYGLQATPTPLDLYPPEETSFAGPMEG